MAKMPLNVKYSELEQSVFFPILSAKDVLHHRKRGRERCVIEATEQKRYQTVMGTDKQPWALGQPAGTGTVTTHNRLLLTWLSAYPMVNPTETTILCHSES